MCWIPPIIPNTLPTPSDFYNLKKKGLFFKTKYHSSLINHTYNIQKLLPVESLNLKIQSFAEWK